MVLYIRALMIRDTVKGEVVYFHVIRDIYRKVPVQCWNYLYLPSVALFFRQGFYFLPGAAQIEITFPFGSTHN